MPRPLSHEPAVAAGIAGPAAVVAAAMLFVHLAAGALLAAVAVTASPGPGTAGGAWDALVWALTLLASAAAAGVLLGAAYAAVAVGVTAPGAETSWLSARVASLVAAAIAAGGVARRRGAPR